MGEGTGGRTERVRGGGGENSRREVGEGVRGAARRRNGPQVVQLIG